jgi:hypothetical protein
MDYKESFSLYIHVVCSLSLVFLFEDSDSKMKIYTILMCLITQEYLITLSCCESFNSHMCSESYIVLFHVG